MGGSSQVYGIDVMQTPFSHTYIGFFAINVIKVLETVAYIVHIPYQTQIPRANMSYLMQAFVIWYTPRFYQFQDGGVGACCSLKRIRFRTKRKYADMTRTSSKLVTANAGFFSRRQCKVALVHNA